MLQIKHISKQYKTGELVQHALRDVSLNLRDNEFVSILGPSGSGKTTLLNIIGGLDRYDTGDLIINGISTKQYKDRDWDSYRNHTIGFVFQSYHLIPHQSVLSNVELALTISGISRNQRRQRAKKALEQVGLGDQMHKRPNQMSGGQMQRVAIARALVNDPDILLADEPTGALDSETSIQIMDLLREVAKDRLVVMVTHNPELAEEYSTRIVKLRDGKITHDSDPFDPEKEKQLQAEHRNMGRAKMSFPTSLSLSFNNLRTKKGRTLLTAFAGSIGIIGIALILALSSGVNNYIADIQKETMTSYPITISAETLDMTGMMNSMMGLGMTKKDQEQTSPEEGVHADYTDIQVSETIASSVIENNLTAFKSYLDDPDSPIRSYLGENGVVYSYDVNFDVYSYDPDGVLVNTNADPEEISGSEKNGFGSMPTGMESMPMMMGGVASSQAKNFSQLMAGTDEQAISQVVTDSYDLLYGSWPEEYNQVVLVLDENNSLPTSSLYQLGLISAQQYQQIQEQIAGGSEADSLTWDYETICGHLFYLVPASDRYTQKPDGTFSYTADGAPQQEQLVESGLPLTISGVIRPKKDAANATISTPVAYTAQLTDYVIQHTNASAVVTAQEQTPDVNVLNGMEFEAPSQEEKVEDAKAYLSAMGVSDKAAMFQMIQYYLSQNKTAMNFSGDPSQLSQGGAMGSSMGSADEAALAQAMDLWLSGSPDPDILLSIYDGYIAGASYEENMESFGKVSYDAPSTISIYTDSFEDKESVSQCIADYNKEASEENQITYTDYVELMTQSLTSIVDIISYVLIAFVAVSLVVSCIMIGIITHISVLERTKEIGILRAMGASKGNISQVFNAETFIIGCLAGVLGVVVSILLTIPINAILQSLLDASALTVSLPMTYGGLLVLLSILITMLGGLLPAKNAAKKDPVAALRTE
ncbi:ABC transporter ATP-binding protein/permease [Intestinimonas butyriciproducens]|uniref:ABC transporter ATP-binding protein/permease n=1 Tax=Intestinimonas butyriciproducens TaxID=1297617 RepID=UPI00195B0478|nr:ABC transporter ATP-binding protein/permease [Intestinimonas butyriciproducens]MBM6918351.1 ABC transporter ATP-binding protein/permease [Intestinimonas butyriciproducens]